MHLGNDPIGIIVEGAAQGEPTHTSAGRPFHPPILDMQGALNLLDEVVPIPHIQPVGIAAAAISHDVGEF